MCLPKYLKRMQVNFLSFFPSSFVSLYFFPVTEEMSEIQPVDYMEMWYREKVLLSL